MDEIIGKAYVVTGYKCKLCGATGSFEEFPRYTWKDENGLKDFDVFCKNHPHCDGWNDDLEEITE